MYQWGIYCRLSKEDDKEKIGSLQAQQEMCESFIKENNLGIIEEIYKDDDITGTTFDRKELNRLTEDIENGKINAVITKDLSRLGRNNAKTLLFLDYLEENQARYVSVTDNYDTNTDEDDIIGIKTWMNEGYVRDLSKKIKSSITQKMKNGEFFGRAPFGYKKKDKKLYIDEKVSQIVEEIFDLYLKGWGYNKIANYLNEKGYITPRKYKNWKNGREFWGKAMVKKILINPAYAGDTVQNRYGSISYKTQKLTMKPEEDWITVEDTHEPIIPKEKFNLVQEIMEKRKSANYKGTKKTPSLFSTFLRCGKCGEKLYFRQGVGTRPHHYTCANYHKYGKISCESHYVNENKLVNLILKDIEQFYNNFENEIISRINNKEKDVKKFEERIKSLNSQIQKNQEKLDILYEDRLEGNITIDFFKTKDKEISKENQRLKEQIDSLRKEIQEVENFKKDKDQVKKAFQDIINKKEVNREDLERCVDKIYVFLPGEIKHSPFKTELDLSENEFDKLYKEGGIIVDYIL